MAQMRRYEWATSDYADAFNTLLRCYDTREPLLSMVRSLFNGFHGDLVAVDWGAGTGELTKVLLEQSQTVYAVEPGGEMRAALSANCPRANIVNGTIMSAILPQKAHVAVMSHVLYHIPDCEWGAHTIHAARQLEPNGVLLVVLKDPDSGCNRMLEHFGAPRFDLPSRMLKAWQEHKEYSFAFSSCFHSIKTKSFDDTLKIARFMMADRGAEAFSSVPSEEQFQDYVRTHLWNESKQVGGFDLGDVYCLIRPNPFDGQR
jgi:SAM-dependent methyltransferase